MKVQSSPVLIILISLLAVSCSMPSGPDPLEPLYGSWELSFAGNTGIYTFTSTTVKLYIGLDGSSASITCNYTYTDSFMVSEDGCEGDEGIKSALARLSGQTYSIAGDTLTFTPPDGRTTVLTRRMVQNPQNPQGPQNPPPPDYPDLDATTPLLMTNWSLSAGGGNYLFAPTKFQWYRAYSRTDYTTITCDIAYIGDDRFTPSNCFWKEFGGTPRPNGSFSGTYQYWTEDEDRTLKLRRPNDIILTLRRRGYIDPLPAIQE